MECVALGMTLQKLLTNHSQSGTGIFGTRRFENGDVVGYFYEPLVYVNKTRHQHMTRTYAEAFMQVT